MTSIQEQLAGRVWSRRDSGFESIREAQVSNGLAPLRSPDHIVRPESEEDVITAVNYAREHRLKIAVRSGGHNWCGASLRDGGLLLDMSSFNNCDIDTESMTATVGPALRNDELVRRLEEQGLAFPAGHCPSVAVGGYLLGGGFGWNLGELGIACWSVLEIDVVTADGRRLTANEQQHSDLFWAARGMGTGFFGVVLGFKLRLYPAVKVKQTSTLIFSADYAEEVGSWIAQALPALPRNVELVAMFSFAPPPLAAVAKHVVIVPVMVFAASEESAREALQFVEHCPVPTLHKVLNNPESFDSLYRLMDGMLPDGKRTLAEAQWLAGDPGELFDRAAASIRTAPSPQSHLMAVVVPPPPQGAVPPDTAFSMGGPVGMMTYAVWDDEAHDVFNQGWHAAVVEEFTPNLIGYYINEANLSAGPDRAERSFAPPVWQRLQKLKQQWDPEGVFHWYLGCERVQAAN